MMRGARTARRGDARHDRVGLDEMRPRALDELRADLPSAGLASTAAGSVVAMPAARNASAGR